MNGLKATFSNNCHNARSFYSEKKSFPNEENNSTPHKDDIENPARGGRHFGTTSMMGLVESEDRRVNLADGAVVQAAQHASNLR